jgi:hypothetical protein
VENAPVAFYDRNAVWILNGEQPAKHFATNP